MGGIVLKNPIVKGLKYVRPNFHTLDKLEN
jgi:hypothetical protein